VRHYRALFAELLDVEDDSDVEDVEDVDDVASREEADVEARNVERLR
jgi:hypothetical protein